MRKITLTAGFLGALLLFGSAAMAQSERLYMRTELSIQGAGFFTKDSQGNGITQHTTDSGGLMMGYRFHINRWLAVDGSYGRARNTQQNVMSGGSFDIHGNMHEAIGALVVTFRRAGVRLQPYTLAGVS